MGNLLELNAPLRQLTKTPVHILDLRWRLRAVSGIELKSSYTPEFRYPSLRSIMREFADQIESFFIEGKNVYNGEKTILFSIAGIDLLNVSYKQFLSAGSGRVITGGIEVESRDGIKYLVLQDGTIHQENKA